MTLLISAWSPLSAFDRGISQYNPFLLSQNTSDLSYLNIHFLSAAVVAWIIKTVFIYLIFFDNLFLYKCKQISTSPAKYLPIIKNHPFVNTCFKFCSSFSFTIYFHLAQIFHKELQEFLEVSQEDTVWGQYNQTLMIPENIIIISISKFQKHTNKTIWLTLFRAPEEKKNIY